jgi:F-type H+-transporting ATPase subunit b
MTQWMSLYLLSSEKEGFGINHDILETNLINIIILIALLVYVLGNFLKENLSSRQEQIIASIQEGEKRLNEANERLAEAKAQWIQAQMIFSKIKNQTKESKASLVETEFHQANADLSQRFLNILMMLRYREQQVFNDVTKQVSELALTQVKVKIQNQLGKTDQSLIIDSKINRLGGHL